MAEVMARAGPWAITLLLHNWPVLLYAGLAGCSAVGAYLRPSRPALRLLYGSLLLGAAFEYEKHGLRVVRGTTHYLLETEPALLATSRLLLIDLAPAAIYLAGLALVLSTAAGPRLIRRLRGRQQADACPARGLRADRASNRPNGEGAQPGEGFTA
jgi:hypothetical protein